MGNILIYKEEISKAMAMLAEDERTVFIGQNVLYPGAVSIHESLESIPKSKKIEFPVAEDLQMGVSIGLSLEGYLPVSIYPRMDFLVIAINQLVNHLDKICEMSDGRFNPKVIIRTQVGTKRPLDPGPQHCQDHTVAFRHLLNNVDVVRLEDASSIMPCYKWALESNRSTILVEIGEMMR